jgi:branched-chain amino acid transport system substrate-binding protein
MKKVTGILLLAVGILTLLYWYSTGRDERSPTAGDKPIMIGFIGSLTGVDPDYGESMRNGLAMAVAEINERGGVGGRQIEVVYEDGKCIEGAKAVSAAQKLISIDKVSLIVDGSCSTGLLAYAPFAEEQQVLVISAGATADSVTDAGEYIFRNVPASSVAGRLLAQVSIDNAHDEIAIVSENSDYAKTLLGAFLWKYEELGGRVVANEMFAPGSSEFRTILLKVRNAQPNALVVNPQSADLVPQIIRQARELGITAQIYIAYFTLPSVVEAGAFVDGTYAVDLPSTVEQSYLDKYAQQFGGEPPYKFSSVLAYDLGYLVADAVRVNGTDTDKIRQYLYDLQGFTGVAGTYHFDEHGDVVGVPHSLRQIQDGNITTIVEEL